VEAEADASREGGREGWVCRLGCRWESLLRRRGEREGGRGGKKSRRDGWTEGEDCGGALLGSSREGGGEGGSGEKG